MTDILKTFIYISHVITILFAVAVGLLLICSVLINALVWQNYKKRREHELTIYDFCTINHMAF